MDGSHLSNTLTYRRSEVMTIGSKVKDMIKGWLDIQEAPRNTFILNEAFNFDTNAIKNRIWMRGDPHELDQFYKQAGRDNSYFWAAVPRIKIRKIHTGLPSMIVRVLANIVVRDMNGINAGPRQVDWDAISKDNKFKDVAKKSIMDALSIGDGAFKISFDKSVSDYPIIEFYPGDKIDIICKRGRLQEVVFKTPYSHDGRKYNHYEHYGYGFIKHVLKRMDIDEVVSLDSIPETAGLIDFGFGGYKEVDETGMNGSRGSFCMAIPFKILDSTKWDGRGESIFDKKSSDFDAFDEIVSQWADAVRAGRVKTYIPEMLLPHDPETLETLDVNPFDDRFVETGNQMQEKAVNKIEVVQPVIASDNYLQSYITFLDLCLQGIISPSTLGIDTKKLDNAEAQREKEKSTLYTRNIIIDAIQDTFPVLVNATLKAYDEYTKNVSGDDIEVIVNFGEYASPSFEATVETVAKGKQGGIISIEASVDELYGDSKDEKWKDKEIKRLKAEQGIQEIQEPMIKNVPALEEQGGGTIETIA